MSDKDPFSNDEPENIYAPPAEFSETGKLCPSCGHEMDSGIIKSSSNVFWVSDNQSSIKTAMLGGDLIGKTKSGFGCKYDAHHCRECKVFVLPE